MSERERANIAHDVTQAWPLLWRGPLRHVSSHPAIVVRFPSLAPRFTRPSESPVPTNPSLLFPSRSSQIRTRPIMLLICLSPSTSHRYSPKSWIRCVAWKTFTPSPPQATDIYHAQNMISLVPSSILHVEDPSCSSSQSSVVRTCPIMLCKHFFKNL